MRMIRIGDASLLRLKRLIQSKSNHCLTSINKESRVRGEELRLLGEDGWIVVMGALLLGSVSKHTV